MTIRARITWLFVIVVAIIVLLFSSLVYFFANQNVFADFYKRLELRARIAAQLSLADSANDANALKELREQYLEKLPAQQQYIIRLNSEQQPDSGMSEALPPEFVQSVLQKGNSFDRKGPVLFAGLRFETRHGNYVVIASGRNDYGIRFLNNLQWLLVASFIIKAMILGFIGFIFSRRILKPLKDFTDKAKNIGAHNLHVRLSTGNDQDEIAVLAKTFNLMLDRLETSFESQKNFVGHASHELRTPLTTIIGEAEWALLKERTPQEYQQTLLTISKQAERLDQITRSLLSLAKTGFDTGKQEMRILRIDEKLLLAKEVADAIYPGNKITLDFSQLPEQEELLQVFGNKDLLQSAFSNLLINACKYSDNQEVYVLLQADEKEVRVSISDRGIGIPAKELPYVFDPFFRASNTSNYKGYGIGLPLARNIIRLHQGEIDVHSEEGKGTRIVVTLPVKAMA